MTLKDAKQNLAEAGYRIIKEGRLSNNTGTRLRLEGGAIVKVFDNGNYFCEGKHYEVVEALLDRGGAPEKPSRCDWLGSCETVPGRAGGRL